METGTRLRIEEALLTWHLPDSAARARYEAYKARIDAEPLWQERARSLEASTCLTAADMTMRIH